MDRRDFLAASLAVVAARTAGADPSRALIPSALAPSPTTAKATLRFGYAAITWGGNDRQAIDDVSAVGFRGIQLRASAVNVWGAQPQVLRQLLADRSLQMVALSSGTVNHNPAEDDANLALHLRHAQFVRDVGGMYLQVVDERPKGRAPTPEDFRRMGRRLTEIGQRTADLGVALGYHNHMGNLGQSPDEVARVLDAADPRVVKLELDIAHYHAAGGDPADAVRQYADRLLFLHLKDVQQPLPGRDASSYRFVELGGGRVDVMRVLAELRRVQFDGWAIVELDSAPDPARSPREYATVARRYLESNGYTL